MGCKRGGRRSNFEDLSPAAAGSRRALRAIPMGKPPATASTRCRFLPEEVAEMKSLMDKANGQAPSRSVMESLSTKFSSSPHRKGRACVLPKQIWTWFQNRRYKLSKQNDGPTTSGRASEDSDCTAEQLLAQRVNSDLQFEAISNRDGAWYDIRSFVAHRFSEAGHPEVCVKYTAEDDEWIDVSSVRRRSLPCESFECLAIHPGDSVLCFQEGDEHALYYDAKVIDVQRKRHDARGCRCRFWIRYDHDQFEEIVPLRKVCRRPETDCRLKKHFGDDPSAAKSTNGQLEQRKLSACTSKPREAQAQPGETGQQHPDSLTMAASPCSDNNLSSMDSELSTGSRPGPFQE